MALNQFCISDAELAAERLAAGADRFSTVALLERHGNSEAAAAVLRAAGDYLYARGEFGSSDLLDDLRQVLEDDAAGTIFWVGVYLEDRAFGGREEGGWWYDYGILQTARWVYQECGAFPSCHSTRAAARAACEQFRPGLDKLNGERRSDTSSVVSEGRFVAMVFENELVKHWPDRKPHYE
jgi:hypothetical protein